MLKAYGKTQELLHIGDNGVQIVLKYIHSCSPALTRTHFRWLQIKSTASYAGSECWIGKPNQGRVTLDWIHLSTFTAAALFLGQKYKENKIKIIPCVSTCSQRISLDKNPWRSCQKRWLTFCPATKRMICHWKCLFIRNTKASLDPLNAVGPTTPRVASWPWEQWPSHCMIR